MLYDPHASAYLNKYYIKVFIQESYDYHIIFTFGEVCSVRLIHQLMRLKEAFAYIRNVAKSLLLARIYHDPCIFTF